LLFFLRSEGWLDFSSTMASSSSFSEDMFIIHPVTARRVLRKRKRQCTGCKLEFCIYFFLSYLHATIRSNKYPSPCCVNSSI
jgi:hypothetical protein